MSIKTFLAGLLLASNLVTAQTNITGRVLADGAPVPAATVSLKNKQTVCDVDGNFIINNVPYGSHTIKISAVGYKRLIKQVMVKNDSAPLILTLTRDSILNEEVVISGTMKPVSKMASPILVEVFTPAFFKKNPSPNIFESLQMVNGVQPQLNCNVCNTGDIHINGMEGPYTMILIDGMPIVSSLSTVYGLAGIPNSMVKRIEIVKGPASTLYGSEAVGGLINIITKDPSTSEKLKLDYSATQIGEHNIDITAAKSGYKLSALLGVNYFEFNQRRDINGDNFTDLTLQNRLSVFNKWNYKASENTTASLGMRVIYETRWGGEMQWSQQFKGTDSVYGEAIKTKRAELISSIVNKKGLSADLSYNYHLQDSYYGKIKYYANQQVLFGQIRWNKKWNNHQLLSGIPLRYTYYDDNTPGTSNALGINQPQHSFLPGIFLQDEVSLSKKLVMLAGMRYDYNSVHGNIFTPRLSFKYSSKAGDVFRFSMGNGYRVVNLFTEDHAALTGAREVIVAGTLKPERSWNANINYSGTYKFSAGFLNIDMSGFYTYFTNKIVGDFLSDPEKIIYDNLKGYAVSKGITINTDGSFINGVKINAGLTIMDVYQANKAPDGKKIKQSQLFAPAVSGTFAISYGLSKQKINFDLTGRFTGPMHLPVVPNDFRREKSPAYTIMNAQVMKQFADNIELYAGVKNLLNFLPQHPLLHPDDPFNKPGGKYFDANGNPRPGTNPYNYFFDTSYNYAPVQGVKLYAGIRYQLK